MTQDTFSWSQFEMGSENGTKVRLLSCDELKCGQCRIFGFHFPAFPQIFSRHSRIFFKNLKTSLTLPSHKFGKSPKLLQERGVRLSTVQGTTILSFGAAMMEMSPITYFLEFRWFLFSMGFKNGSHIKCKVWEHYTTPVVVFCLAVPNILHHFTSIDRQTTSLNPPRTCVLKMSSN